MKNGPELWTEVLKRFPPGAVVAGGAIRDWVLNVEPKDIDVFYGPIEPTEPPVTIDNPFGARAAFDPRLGFDRIDNMFERKAEYDAMSNIALVSRGTMFGFTVDAVEVTDFKDGHTLVEGFDFAMNRCWFGTASNVHDEYVVNITHSAIADLGAMTCTLLLTDRLERSRARFKRFNSRMGGSFRLVEAA